MQLHRRNNPRRSAPSIAVPLNIDRKKSCPMLIRVFAYFGSKRSASDYQGEQLPEGEVHIHTWKDASLREIGELLGEAFDGARGFGSKLSISTIFVDRNGNYHLKNVGTIAVGKRTMDDDRKLGDLKFQPGDYLDISIQR